MRGAPERNKKRTAAALTEGVRANSVSVCEEGERGTKGVDTKIHSRAEGLHWCIVLSYKLSRPEYSLDCGIKEAWLNKHPPYLRVGEGEGVV